MLPRLQAEERLNAITDGAVAAGSASAELSRNAIRELKSQLGAGARKRSKADPAALIAMGIGVTDLSEASQEGPSDG